MTVNYVLQHYIKMFICYIDQCEIQCNEERGLDI